ncbi:putative glycerol dehydrogenase Gcy1 [Ascodesmis nigricans]|uniref:Putative glycerol dehydrogenase Gcy1 n=1 Tax=Ascodesmis nigricans TaxID=341454 RepID=A0A4S2MXS3_9PEZI|nr:putative glycerol dehydrogenase Gcy1 [Ascodesmis nigricans]
MDWTKKTAKLHHGKGEIPLIGLGTWQAHGPQVSHAVEVALRVGYRHIDTAARYENETAVGEGIRASGVPREEIWVTTKLRNHEHMRVEEAVEESLRRLGLDYVDLYLMHWPCSTDPSNHSQHLANWDFTQTWASMQSILTTGKVRNIGVSNFGLTHLTRLLSSPSTTIIPAVNQIELHPYNPSPKLVTYLMEKGIHITAHSCLGSVNSPLHKEEALVRVAEKTGRSTAQVLLKWGLQMGWSVIPKSADPGRVRENWGMDGWELREEDMRAMVGIKERRRVCGDAWLPVRVFLGDDE